MIQKTTQSNKATTDMGLAALDFSLNFPLPFQQDTESCADLGLLATLPPMPDFAAFPRGASASAASFPSELLRAIYASFHSLSAHFHFMRADWRRGRSCPGRGSHSDIVSGVHRWVRYFGSGYSSYCSY